MKFDFDDDAKTAIGTAAEPLEKEYWLNLKTALNKIQRYAGRAQRAGGENTRRDNLNYLREELDKIERERGSVRKILFQAWCGVARGARLNDGLPRDPVVLESIVVRALALLPEPRRGRPTTSCSPLVKATIKRHAFRTSGGEFGATASDDLDHSDYVRAYEAVVPAREDGDDRRARNMYAKRLRKKP